MDGRRGDTGTADGDREAAVSAMEASIVASLGSATLDEEDEIMREIRSLGGNWPKPAARSVEDFGERKSHLSTLFGGGRPKGHAPERPRDTAALLEGFHKFMGERFRKTETSEANVPPPPARPAESEGERTSPVAFVPTVPAAPPPPVVEASGEADEGRRAEGSDPSREGREDDRGNEGRGRMPVSVEVFDELRRAASARPVPSYGIELERLLAWSESCGECASPEAFAVNVCWILKRFGTGTDVTRGPHEEGASSGPDMPGREAAMADVWTHRDRLFRESKAGPGGAARGLPWIAARLQLATTTGESSGAADRSVERMAAMDGMSTARMYAAVAEAKGLRIESVDLVLWTAFAYGIES